MADIHEELKRTLPRLFLTTSKKPEPTILVCLGDVASFGPSIRARKRLRRVQELCCPVALMGNADWEMLVLSNYS